MLRINFYPDSDRHDDSEAIEFFEKYWKEHGQAIIDSYRKHSHKDFKETVINATVSKYGISRSHPLHLRSNTKKKYWKGLLIHEMGHRILQGVLDRRISPGLESHQLLYLILVDVYKDLLTEEECKDIVHFELADFKPDFYREAWEWAAQFDTYEKRQAKLKELYETKPDVIE